MFVHNFDPVLLNLGPLEIRYYSIPYIVGFLLVWWILHKQYKQLKITKDQAGDITFWLTVGVIIGSRLYSTLVWYPSYYLSQPWKILYLWEGGMAFHGGVIGIIVAAYYLAKKYKISFGKLADILTIPVVFALALGRLANFINGELYGPVTNVPWCVQFPDAEGCRHPYQIYSALKRFAMVGVLLLLNKKKHKDGFLFWITLLLFGIGRFLLDFVREDTLYASLSIGQWSSLLLAVIAGYALLKYYKKDLKLKKK